MKDLSNFLNSKWHSPYSYRFPVTKLLNDNLKFQGDGPIFFCDIGNSNGWDRCRVELYCAYDNRELQQNEDLLNSQFFVNHARKLKLTKFIKDIFCINFCLNFWKMLELW